MLTAAQTLVLRPVVLAEPSLAEAVQAGDDSAIAGWCNGIAAPDYFVWRSSVSRHEIITAASPEGTYFTWAAAGYITRSQGERDAFREMFNSTGTVNGGLKNIQAAFNDIFSGAGGAPNRAHVFAILKRKATRAEKALAALTAPGFNGVTADGTLANPAWLGFEGNVTQEEASLLR